jgi:hypothetical protein
MHYDDGGLRAYLDGEISSDARDSIAAHLTTCADCQTRLARVSQRAELATRRLAALTPQPGEALSHAPAALARFQRTSGSAGKLPTAHSPVSTDYWRNRMTSLSSLWRSHRLLWGSLAGVLVLALLFSLAPVREAAAQLLGMFRVRKFAVIEFNPNQTQLDNRDLASNISNLLAENVTVLKEPGAPQTVATAAEASALASIPVRLPASLPAGVEAQPEIRVEDGGAVQIVVNRERAQALIELAGLTDVQLPQALDGATVTIEVPPVVLAQYGAYGGDFTLTQMRSPAINLPPGVDLAQLGEAGLRLLGLSPEEARQFSRSIDWSSTLVIPLPTNVAEFRDVTVDGVNGVLITESRTYSGYGGHYVLLWQKDDVVYSLAGRGDVEQLLTVANSLQ